MGNAHGQLGNAQDDMFHNSSGEIDYEMVKASLNGELHVLFSERPSKQPQQWRENLNKIIGLLSRKIHLMQTHSNVLFDIGVLCTNVQYMEDVIWSIRGDNRPHCDSLSNADAIGGDTQLLQNMQELRRILIYFEQNYGVPNIVSTEPLQEYLRSLKHHYQFKGYDLFGQHTATAKKEGRDSSYVAIKKNEELKEFQKHEDALTEVISKIFGDCYGIYRNDMHSHAIAIIERYIENLNKIIDNLELPAEQIDEVIIRNIDRCVLKPGCEMFDIHKGGSTPEEAMTPIDILTQLKMKAGILLRNETMVIEWEKHQQEKKIWMDASRHSYSTKANKSNKAKALLTSGPYITSEERAKMLASGGIMTSLVDALVKPPPSQMRDDKLKSTILNRRSGGSRKTNRRHRRSRRK